MIFPFIFVKEIIPNKESEVKQRKKVTAVQIDFSLEELKTTTHFLNRYIKGIVTTPEAQKREKKIAFQMLQKLSPLCEWEEGEEKIIISSREQFETFL